MNKISDFKLAKFELMVENTNNYLVEGITGCSGFSMGIRLSKNNYENNELVSSVMKLVFYNPFHNENTIKSLKEDIEYLNRKECTLRNRLIHCKINSFKAKYGLIFWLVFLLAIDDEFYNDEIETVSDLACSLNFTPEMMLDWCNAVKYVLAGNVLSETCDLDVKTKEAKQFFVHKY